MKKNLIRALILFTLSCLFVIGYNNILSRSNNVDSSTDNSACINEADFNTWIKMTRADIKTVFWAKVCLKPVNSDGSLVSLHFKDYENKHLNGTIVDKQSVTIKE